MGKYAEIDILLELESASDRWLGFEKLVGLESILIGKPLEFETLLQPESWAVEFRELAIR
jgi:hypothetical protein